jgi:hypothetical protein
MVDYKTYYNRLKEDLRTKMGRNVLTFLIFWVIATIFWFVMALNDEVQKDYKLPLSFLDFPENLTVISGEVPTVNVTVKDKGSALAKFAWGSAPQLKLNYSDFTKSKDNHLQLSSTQLSSAIRQIFGSSASLISIRPDSLYLHYTTNPGVPVRVVVDAEISTLPQYEQFGAPRASTDTVMIYSNLKERLHLKEIKTAPISLSRLADSTTVEVNLIVPEGMRAIPSTIKVTIPIEPLVSKTRKLNIEAINVPAGTRLIPFPSVVEATFLVPKSVYTTNSTTLKAVIDYKDVSAGKSTIPVKLSGVPAHYQNATLATREVEYLVEKD